ncbi:hypothetical protein [Bradyrhizobium sp. AZCC 1578]|uniref:hypothetical protein n=1 Tax=Bradyrhizobium sp. AZCC 1578 TaxID=3117027 RepID=UPI002FEF29AF
MYDEDDYEGDVAPETREPVKNKWHTDELANEVREILAALEAPPADGEVMDTFQRTIFRGRQFGVDGRGRVVLTCRCILESEGNEDAFREPFVSAVAGVCGDEFAGRELELIEAFDRINLVGIFETMRALEYFRLSDVPSVVSAVVRNKVRRLLSPPSLPAASKKGRQERKEEAKRERRALISRVVERKIELGRKLAALRDAIPGNKQFGWAVRKQFDIDDSSDVTEMMRVARLYGDRPEIFCNASWHALTELASSATSEGERRKFETRISAGERVNGAEIIRARATIGVRTPRSARDERANHIGGS